MISVVAGEQFWRRRIDSYPLKTWSAEEVGVATLLSQHAPFCLQGSAWQENSVILLQWEITWWLQPCLVQSFHETHSTMKSGESPERPEQLIQEPSRRNLHPLLTGDRSKVTNTSGKHSTSLQPARIPYILCFLYTIVKPWAWIFVLHPFHSLSLQPYRNSWVTSEKNTHKITMKTDVSRKEKPCMRSCCAQQFSSSR